MISDKKNLYIVANVFDMGARMHGPLFTSPTLSVMWKNVYTLLEERKAPMEEVAVFVYGEFDMDEVKKPYQPYLFPVVFSAFDKRVMAHEEVESLLGKFSGGDGDFALAQARQQLDEASLAASVKAKEVLS